MALMAVHPGEVLAQDLAALGMSAAELARQLQVPANRITAILNGQRAVTGDTALRLAHYFGTSAAFWLNLQGLYEIRLAEKQTGKAIGKLPRLTGRWTRVRTRRSRTGYAPTSPVTCTTPAPRAG